MATTTTHVVTSIATIFKSVIESSVVYSTVEVTITNAETQTNWDYITATTVGKRVILAPTSTMSEAMITAKFPVILPATSVTPDHTHTVAETAGIETVQARQAEPDASTLVAVQSTSTIYQAVTGAVTVTSTTVSTTTALKTSTTYQTLFQTKTVVLNAKTTVKATSTWTITSHFPVTLTVTAVATDAPSETSSTVAPALITNVASGKKKSSVSLSTGAIAGIAIAATFVGVALCVMLFFVWLRHQKQKREREAITEDYAYLGTGRSHGFDTAQAKRSNSGNGSGGNSPPLLYRNTYSGPPTNSARMSSVHRSSMAMAQVESNERGLPPTPWYTTKDNPNPNPNTNARPSPRISLSTSLATSPTSPTVSAQPYGNEMNHQLALGRAVHTRSGSAQTMATATSSTVFGGGNNSTRNSMRSNSGKTTRLSSSGNPHKRASSSGAGSGITNDTIAIDQFSEDASKESVYNYNKLTPTELASTPAPMKETQPDPPSPMLEPRLGPLRIMNASAPARDSVEELPKIDNESASCPPTTLSPIQP
ncbi:hypothetical protein SEPCBS57363_000369 [Sporothrix epigloea]|uniref:Uncharacterized protein n=1 Tax=Sporothrix epigloea TaxID=1892477 RepID=A0ABP0D4B1_9PEZI